MRDEQQPSTWLPAALPYLDVDPVGVTYCVCQRKGGQLWAGAVGALCGGGGECVCGRDLRGGCVLGPMGMCVCTCARVQVLLAAWVTLCRGLVQSRGAECVQGEGSMCVRGDPFSVPLNDHTAVGLSSVPVPLGGAGGGLEKGQLPTLRDLGPK